jgi:hypothetical protein
MDKEATETLFATLSNGVNSNHHGEQPGLTETKRIHP